MPWNEGREGLGEKDLRDTTGFNHREHRGSHGGRGEEKKKG